MRNARGAGRSACSFIRGGRPQEAQSDTTSLNLMRGQPRLAAILAPPALHHSLIRPLSDFGSALQPSTAQRGEQPCPGCIHSGLHPRSPAATNPRQPSHARRASNSLAEPSSCKPSRTLERVEITSSSYTTQSIPIPELHKVPLQSLLSASLLPHPPR